MPAFSTHYIFATELYDKISDLADFELDRGALLIGAQGPDIFFFHRILPFMRGKSMRKIGSELHRARPDKIFGAMRDYIPHADNSDIAKSYVYGFFLHYALDRKCHPYVYYLQDRIVELKPSTNPHTAHNDIEFAMDSYLLNKRLGIESPIGFDTAATLEFSDEALEEIASLLCYVLERVLDFRTDASSIKQAVVDTKYIQKITNDPKDIKKKIIYPLELAAAPLSKNYKITSMMRHRDLEKAKKYGNIDNRLWTSPYSGEASADSFEDLFDKAMAEAVDMIIGFQRGDDTRDITENKSFLTGVEA